MFNQWGTQKRERIKNVDFGGWAGEEDLGGVGGQKIVEYFVFKI